jgi:hypothetical protein
MSNRPIGVPSRASPLDPKDRKEKRRKEKRREENRTDSPGVPVTPPKPLCHNCGEMDVSSSRVAVGISSVIEDRPPRGFTPTATGSTSRRLAMLAMGCCKQHFAKGFSDEPEFHPGKAAVAQW